VRQLHFPKTKGVIDMKKHLVSETILTFDLGYTIHGKLSRDSLGRTIVSGDLSSPEWGAAKPAAIACANAISRCFGINTAELVVNEIFVQISENTLAIKLAIDHLGDQVINEEQLKGVAQHFSSQISSQSDILSLQHAEKLERETKTLIKDVVAKYASSHQPLPLSKPIRIECRDETISVARGSLIGKSKSVEATHHSFAKIDGYFDGLRFRARKLYIAQGVLHNVYSPSSIQSSAQTSTKPKSFEVCFDEAKFGALIYGLTLNQHVYLHMEVKAITHENKEVLELQSIRQGEPPSARLFQLQE
jgi:hypothetical protein